MSTETRPISPASFALAIQDLPMENLYTKAHELKNSITHLSRSNALLKEYSDSTITTSSSHSQGANGRVSLQSRDANDNGVGEEQGDPDCLEAIRENEVVIQRQRERILLLRREVERRGARWHEGDLGAETEERGEREGASNGTSATSTSTITTNHGNLVNGDVNGGEPNENHLSHPSAATASADAGVGTGASSATSASTTDAPPAQPAGAQRQGGSLTDEELRRRLEERMAQELGDDDDDESGGGDGGVYL